MRIILRADGNEQIGFGHVFRLLAIAEILRDSFNCIFAITRPPEFLLETIRVSCKDYIILGNDQHTTRPETGDSYAKLEPELLQYLSNRDILVLDGYHFGTAYQQSVKNVGVKLVAIDDFAKNYFFADAVINHAPGVSPALYKRPDTSKLFLGLDYAILRMPFYQSIEGKKESVQGAFISLGGSDPKGLTARLTTMLLNSGFSGQLNILCSSSFSSQLQSELKQLQLDNESIKLYVNVNASEIVELMARCKFAFVSASTVLVEAYSRGLTCFAGYYADNQEFMYKGFVKQQFAAGLGNFEELDQVRLEKVFGQIESIIPLTNALQSSFNIRKIFQSLHSN